MIVEQVGYFKLNDVKELKENGKLFSIYKTNKNTMVLVLDTKRTNLHLSYPKKDRLPWKTVEGKKIARCELVLCSDDDTEITTCGWNNNEQIIVYEEFSACVLI
jgi:hypothetical protein